MRELTKRQKELRRKYTSIEKYFGETSAVLTIGSQGFILHPSDTRKSANWMRDMLAIAIDRMITNESNNIKE